MTTALILGGAECVWDDVRRALELFTPDVIVAVNDAALRYGGEVHHVVTLHPDKFATPAKQRHPRCVVWAHAMKSRNVDHVTSDWGGSSGLLAVKVTVVELGIKRSVLAGMPMDKRPNFTRGHKPWKQADSYWKGWRRRTAQIVPYVRSMSGRTAQMLGEPTREWLNNGRNEHV